MPNRYRMAFVVVIISLLFFTVGVRLFFIQVWNHEELKNKVERMVFRERSELSSRGGIYDRSGKILAMTVKNFALFLDPRMITDIARTRSELAKAGIEIEVSDKKIAEETGAYLPAAKDLNYEQAEKAKGFSVRGVGFIPGVKRCYPEGKLACHVLGVVGREGRGLEGIEYYCNSFLAGKNVKGVSYRDGKGREISEKIIDPGSSKGSDVFLTIDRNIQFITEQEIEKAWKESGAKRAIAIVQDPNTGEILALACRPNFNPGDFSDSGEFLKNPAVTDIFEPGSTFKLVTMAAALEENAVNLKENIWCENGKYQVYRHVIKDHEKKGFLNASQIMEYSSNIGAAKIGQRLGKEKMYQYVRQFGFASRTGIDLPGETPGILRPPERWSGLSLPVISFGQEVGVTALQMINAYSAVINGGMLLEPKIVRQIKNPSNLKAWTNEKREVRRIISPETAETLKKMLVNVVENGTGQAAQVQGYSIGGKTGTAQKRDPATGKYSSSKYVASFCGALPISDPQLTIFVMLDEPLGDYWASSRAAPVFSRIAGRTASYLRIAPDKKNVTLCNAGQRKE
ncbi:MAG: penicillin-binding protein 2 [Endomicrobiales bacterium]|nr:penicillin-binding protein 2 [Endomicrobiales bacterium]